MEKFYLNTAYDNIMKKINKQENFTLMRYGDGERAIMTGKQVTALENWSSPLGENLLGKNLLQTLNLNSNNVYYGISCPCCDQEAYYWYISRINNKNITFSNLFVNINYRRFIKDFETINREAVVIGNYKGATNNIGNLKILKYYSISDNCFDFFDHELFKLIKQIKLDFGEKNNLLYVISAGPLAEIIIYYLYKNNPNNCYIDFGSSIDCYIHKKDTRAYCDINSIYANRNCWMFNPITTNFDVSVLLTVYKKPDTLEKQLSAIMKQSLKPKEILLFQDGINEPYKISINNDLLNLFSKYKINDVNQGVWERFKFAQEAKSEYICLFDDDTIPGTRWLENCHYNMMFNKGIYGTIGIILKNFKGYPYKNYYRVGWAQPFSKLIKVDFVGHSWFFPKKYLEYMFDNTNKYQEYKYVAEDMCLSFKCKEKGINTYVPPHPYFNEELWGSQKEYAYKFGTTPTAISSNSNSFIKMNTALQSLKKDGWDLIYNKEKYSIKYKFIKIKYEELKYKIKREYYRTKNKITKKSFNL